MPYIEIKVAKSASRKQEQLITSHLGTAMEEILGKDPKGLMVSVQSDIHLYLGGEFMEYASYVHVVTANEISEDKCKVLNATIAALMEEDFKVPKENTYIVFKSADHFGVKGNLI